ncbi:MAG: general secretion pathway protein GspB [Noviherbaspirillum sp.]
MSYILEALKKAEAERNGSVPRTQHAPPPYSKAGKRRTAARKPWLWIALAASACVLIGLLWFGATRTNPQRAAPVPPPPATPLQVQAPQAAPRAATLPPVAAAPEPKPAAPIAQQERPVPKSKEDVVKKAPEKTHPPAVEAPKPAPVAPAEAPIATLRELPELIQREIPPLAIGGYIYSGNKADRSILINNRLLREGDEVVPGLLLEKMTPAGMVLNYKGYRYRTSY